jgi:hypothetical protein
VVAGEKGFAVSGRAGMLRAMLSAQKALYANRRIDGYDLALTYCLLGDKQHALDLLQTAVAKHEARATSVRLNTTCGPCMTIPLFASWSRRLACRHSNERQRNCHLAPRNAHSELALDGGDVFGIVEFGFDVDDVAPREIVE